jgi:hypothetical protein
MKCTSNSLCDGSAVNRYFYIIVSCIPIETSLVYLFDCYNSERKKGFSVDEESQQRSTISGTVPFSTKGSILCLRNGVVNAHFFFLCTLQYFASQTL